MVLDKIKILSLLIQEGTPLIITAYKNNVAKTNLEKAIENNKKYFEEAQKISDKSHQTRKSDKKGVTEVVEEKECIECGRPESSVYETQPSLDTLPPDVTDKKDPHYDYTVRELSKHLSLLQNHYTDYRCPNCIPTGDMVFTNPSYKPIEDIQVGDKVLTHKGDYRTVKEIYERDYVGDMYNIVAGYTSLPLRATPEHPVLGIKNVRVSQKDLWRKDNRINSMPLSWIPIDKLTTNDFIVFPRLQNINDLDSIDVSKIVDNILVFDKYVIPKNFSPTVNKITRFVNVDEDFMELIGYYIAEGMSGKYKRGGSIIFSFGQNEQDYADRVHKLIKNIFGLQPKIRVVKTGIQVSASSEILANLFGELFGHRSYEKKLPVWIFSLPDNKIYSLLKSMINGDGSISKYSIKYATVSKTLAFQLRTLLFRLGLLHGYIVKKPRVNAYIEGRKVNEREQYHISISGNSARKLSSLTNIKYDGGKITSGNHGYVTDKYVFLPILKIEKNHYSGKVHNLHIEDANSFVMLQGVVHNCINKHLMIIEGLGEEGVPMVKDKEEKKRFQEVIKWAKKAKDRTDYDDLIDESRDVRIKLTGMEHGNIEESDEDEHNHEHEEE